MVADPDVMECLSFGVIGQENPANPAHSAHSFEFIQPVIECAPLFGKSVDESTSGLAVAAQGFEIQLVEAHAVEFEAETTFKF